MRLNLLPLVAMAVASGLAYADPVGVQRILPSSEYERLHDGYAFGPAGQRLNLRGAPAFWVRMDSPAEEPAGERQASAAQGDASQAALEGGTCGVRGGCKATNHAAVFFATASDLPLDVGSLDFLDLASAAEFMVTGRADSVGSAGYNAALSKRRAEQVSAYLQTRGVEAGRIRITAKGEADPVATNSTHDGRARNRQVQVEVIKK